MATGVHSWSTTAANNGTADSNAPWPEGMAPSQVNDSARATLASVAKWRDDTNGANPTSGTSTAYTLTSNQGFASLSAMGNAVIAFVPHTTNGAAPTLAVDGLTAKKIRFATGEDIPSNSLIQGTPYVCTYFAGVGEFILHNIAGNPYNIPLGAGMDYWLATTPNSAFVFPYGQAISRTTYATLFAGMGTTHGVGDGSTTFNLPDKRGRTSAGKDDMGGSSANRLTNQSGGLDGDTLGATGGSETHTLTGSQTGPHTHTGTTGTESSTHTHSAGSFTIQDTQPDFTSEAIAGASDGTRTYANAESDTTKGVSGTSGGQSVSHTHTFTTDSGGSGSAHNNVQPTIICNYILRII